MRYQFNFKTQYSMERKIIGEKITSDQSPLIVFTLNLSEQYPILMIEGIDIIEVLNKAKQNFFELLGLESAQLNTTWKSLDNKCRKKLKEKNRNMLPIANEATKVSANIQTFSNYDVLIHPQATSSEMYFQNILTEIKKVSSFVDYINTTIHKTQHAIYSVYNKYHYKHFLENIIHELYILDLEENQINKIIYFIKGNLHQCIKKLIVFEQQLLETSYAKNQYALFKNMYNRISPYLNKMYNNMANRYLPKYYFEFSDSVEIHKESRKSIKDFIPSGMCFYNEKIFINTKVWTQNKYGKDWKNLALHHIVWHELAHAIDFFDEMKDAFKSYNWNNTNRVNKILSLTKKNYKKSLLLKKKEKERVDYYTAPLTNENDNVLYDWTRARAESIAESMSFLMKWLQHGFGKEEYLILHSNIVGKKLLCTLSDTISYLLKEIDWSYLGINNHLMIKRKIQIKNYLKKINSSHQKQTIFKTKTSLAIKPSLWFT